VYQLERDAGALCRTASILELRRRVLPEDPPPELVRQLTPPYRGAQYLIIGDNLVMVDNRDYVLDVIRFGDLRDDRRGPR
jgi:hypothetical protein